ncbi:MAG: VOC family virulence protein [Cellvibrionales bacterium]|nr:MAG: VOC family virulence protein [Cellvibrionales bacterium]
MIKAFDHVAIPIQKVDEMIAFYQALGCEVSDDFGKRLYSIHFGDNKINFHTPEIWQSGKFSLRGPTAQPGCGDFCFVWGDTEVALHQLLTQLNADIEEGPVERIGGRNGGRDSGTSVYIRDPDKNLLEFMVYPD